MTALWSTNATFTLVGRGFVAGSHPAAGLAPVGQVTTGWLPAKWTTGAWLTNPPPGAQNVRTTWVSPAEVP